MAVMDLWYLTVFINVGQGEGVQGSFGVCLRFAGSLATYVVTSLQLALAFPAEVGGGVAASFAKFAGIFAVTQLPLSAVEGLLTVYVFNFLMEYNQQELSDLNLLELPIKSA